MMIYNSCMFMSISYLMNVLCDRLIGLCVYLQVDDEEDDLDLDYTSPTDMIEINAFFISAMEVISQREPETMKSLQGYINEEDKGRLAQIMQFAQEKAAQSVTAAAATP